jgi:hypothetical protein
MLTTSAAGAVLDDVLAPEHDPTSALEALYPDVQTPVLTSEVLLVTRAMAEAWLAARHPNRRILAKRVEELAAIMRQDGWCVNGEPILLDEDGRLLDGQHRLTALVQVGKPLPFLVVTGVPIDVQATLGQAIQRSRADILAMHQQTNTKALAGALGVLWRYDHGLMLEPKRRFFAQHTLEILLRYPGLSASMSWGLSVRRFLPGAVGSAVHYLMSQRDRALAKHVFTRLRDGLELTASDPLHTLRERLIEARTRLPRPQPWILALWCVRTWNAMRNGGSPAHLPWDPQVDRFPHVQ